MSSFDYSVSKRRGSVETLSVLLRLIQCPSEGALSKIHCRRLISVLTVFWLSTRFLPLDGTLIFKQIELNTKNSTKQQQSCRLVEFLVFNLAFGRHTNQLISSTLSSVGYFHVEVIISWTSTRESPTDENVLGIN